MDKYEELKNYILMQKSDCEKLIKEIHTEIVNTNPEDIDKLRELADELQDRCDDFQWIRRRNIRLESEAKKFTEMFNGFYDVGNSLKSFVYQSILKYDYHGDIVHYRVGDKFFDTIEEAKEYSISLGKREDCVECAYSHL